MELLQPSQDPIVDSGTADAFFGSGSQDPLAALTDRYNPAELRFRPEDSPFTTLFADITHRCNMACRNCYIPVRDLPDLPVDWLYDILARLPCRTRIRLVGAEPTMREDLPAIIAKVKTNSACCSVMVTPRCCSTSCSP